MAYRKSTRGKTRSKKSGYRSGSYSRGSSNRKSSRKSTSRRRNAGSRRTSTQTVKLVIEQVAPTALPSNDNVIGAAAKAALKARL